MVRQSFSFITLYHQFIETPGPCYEESHERLKKFYGDPQKVVSCIMEEVLSLNEIQFGDYRGLLSYVDVLEGHFNRLQNLEICPTHKL